jgi:hypothetical protein
VAHDLDWCDVTGKDNNALLALSDPSLNVLETVANVGLLFHTLLDAFVKLKNVKVIGN